MEQNKAKEKETILTLCTALIIIFLISKGKNIYLLESAAVLGFIGMFSDFLSAKIHWAWMKLAEAMGFVMNKVILGIVFYIFLTPIALLSKLTGKKTFEKNKQAQTFYVERNHTYSSSDLEKPW